MTDKQTLIEQLKNTYPWTKEAAELWEKDIERLNAFPSRELLTQIFTTIFMKKYDPKDFDCGPNDHGSGARLKARFIKQCMDEAKEICRLVLEGEK